jgi:AraC-like DNA-binding protein
MIEYYPAPAGMSDVFGVAYTFATPVATRLPLPAMNAQLRVVLDGHFADIDAGGTARRSPRVALVGPSTCASQIACSAGSRLVGLGLLPGGWAHFIDASADLLSDRTVDLAAVLGERRANEIGDTVQALAAISPQLAASGFADVFARVARPRSVAGGARITRVDRWLDTAAALPLDDLAQQLNLSHRQMARIVRHSYGLSPKTLQMKYRALGQLVQLSLGPTHPAIDADHYCDQSHAIRDFKRFVGETPGAFQRHSAPFARALISGRWRAGARSAVSLWS